MTNPYWDVTACETPSSGDPYGRETGHWIEPGNDKIPVYQGDDDLADTLVRTSWLRHYRTVEQRRRQ